MTKEYLARKEAEGKTPTGALRALKRHLARRFHRLLSEPAADQRHAAKAELPAIAPHCPQRDVDPNSNGVAPYPTVCIT